MGFKPIHAKKPNLSTFYCSLQTESRPIGDLALADFQKITATWEHKPNLKVEMKFSRAKLEIFTGVVSNWSPGKDATADDILMFNTRGTKVKHVLLTPGFRAKTRKGLIGSGSGSGGVIKVSKEIQGKGIEAREHEQTVAKKEKAKIKSGFQGAMVSSARRANWTL